MELKTSARMDQLAPSGIRKVNEKALAMERAILRAVQSAGSAYGLIGWEDLPR